jgi:aryl-alcohol dehydrogenase-like predicted oxidoreductase
VIDVYLCHVGDLKDPTIFLEAFDTLKRHGKIRFAGISTNSPEVVARFNARNTCDVIEFDYSLLNRQPEELLLPYCQEHNIGTIARGVLAMGLLGGKYKETDTFTDEVRRGWNTGPAREQFVARVRKVEALKAAAPQDRPLAHTAIQYTLAHPAVHCTIPGAKSPAQVDANIAAGNTSLTPAQVETLRAV